jgi:mannose/fructose/N-acetylgalactosamine-specific phosphotransferase system component IIC
VKIKEVSISCRFKGVEGSTYNPLRHAVSVMGSVIRYASEKRPLLVFGLPAALVLTVGLALFIHVLQTYFATKQFALGYMLTSMIAIMVAVFAIFTAVILHVLSNLIQKNNSCQGP